MTRSSVRLHRSVFVALASLTATPVALAHADGASPTSALEGSLRIGGAAMGYEFPGQTSGPSNVSGPGIFIEGDAGVRYRDWTVGASIAFLLGFTTTPNFSTGVGTLDVTLGVLEVGLGLTWHHGALSLGAGAIPVVHVQLSATGFAGTDNQIGGELHGGYELWRQNRVRVQLFTLVEGDHGNSPGTNGSLTAVRIGLGVTY